MTPAQEKADNLISFWTVEYIKQILDIEPDDLYYVMVQRLNGLTQIGEIDDKED